MSTAPEAPNTLSRINDPAPDFEARSTHGALKLSDFAEPAKLKKQETGDSGR